MSSLDLIPVVSQVKSVCQLIAGDDDGAERTARNFYTKTPVISHVTGVVVGTVGLITDNDDCKNFAVEAFEGGIRTTNNVLDAIPVVGHTKGVIHLLLGDKEGAMRAFKSSSVLFEITDELERMGFDRNGFEYEDVLELVYNDRSSNRSRHNLLLDLAKMRQRLNEAFDKAQRNTTESDSSECEELRKLREYRRKANEAFDNMERKVQQS